MDPENDVDNIINQLRMDSSQASLVSVQQPQPSTNLSDENAPMGRGHTATSGLFIIAFGYKMGTIYD